MIAAIALAAALTITPAARAMQPGEVVRLDIAGPAPITAVTAKAFNATITGYQADAADPRHWRVLVGIDLGQWPGLKAYHARIASRPAAQAAMKAEGLIK